MSGKVDQKIQAEADALAEKAYDELFQIITKALQDLNIKEFKDALNQWEHKYSKLLNGSLPNAKLLEKIKRLKSDAYIGYIIDMIMKMITIKEYVKIENQSKAFRKLYSIIKETNDFDTLKSKVEAWKKTYPIQSFMKMYRNKYNYYTRTQTLKENSFEQEKAFYDLAQIANSNGTPKDFQDALDKWEKTYNIHDKFELDDFIKHQSEVKRYVEEIKAKSEPSPETADNPSPETTEQFSDIAIQTIAINSLFSIVKDSNNLDKVFNWVHKNSSVKFNDINKRLILSKVSSKYSPAYLAQLQVPNINVLGGPLTLDEYRQIDEIKRYAIISYFNLLLPADQAYANDFFKNYVKDIYYKSKNIKIRDNIDVSKATTDHNQYDIEQENEAINLQPKIDKKEGIPELEVSSDISQEVSIPETPTQEVDVTLDSTPKQNIKDIDITLDNSQQQTTKESDVEPKILEKATTPGGSIIPDDTQEEKNEKNGVSISISSKNSEYVEPPEFSPLDDLDIIFEQPLDDSSNSFEIDLSQPTYDWHSISDAQDNANTNTASSTSSSDSKQNIDTIAAEIEEEPVPAADKDILESVTYSEVETKKSTPYEASDSKLETKVSNENNVTNENNKREEIEEPEKPEEIDITLYSPLFFDAIYNLSYQVNLMQRIDNSVEQRIHQKRYTRKTDLTKNKSDIF